MDNLTHSLVGWALAETGLKRRTRKGLAACVLAANMPDIDVFFGWSPWGPLATHRGFTHGLLGGVLLMPPLLAGLLWLLDRWQARRGVQFASGLPMHGGWLVALSYFGAITHPLLDLQNVYAVQLLSLASTRWFHTDALFIVSPWLLGILGTGIWLARRKSRGAPAVTALLMAMGFIVLNLGISAMAWNAPAVGPPHAEPDRIFASPEPLLFWKRDVIWRERGEIGFGRYDPLHNLRMLTAVEARVPDRMTDPAAILAAAATPEVRKFLAWSQLPVASIRPQGCTTLVTFGDARFSGPALSRNFNVSVLVPSDHRGCPGPR
jgi:inner membrane protein